MMHQSLRDLLTGIVDYAGLFPPAGLAMQQAVANYDAYRGSEHAWMLGRFIVPVARLAEFEEAANPLPASTDIFGWHLSAISSPNEARFVEDFTADLARIGEFNRQHNRDIHDSIDDTYLEGFLIDAVEVKVTTGEDVRRIAATLAHNGEAVSCYCEIPLGETMLECLDAINAVEIGDEAGVLAKVRTGGLDASGFPSGDSLIRFIHACCERNVSFKATAGLHHPLRGTHPFTYQEQSESGVMHGFLNVFLAAAFIVNGMAPDEARRILDETSPNAFRFEPDGIVWRTHHLDTKEIQAARNIAISFGSCSFTEPIQDLRTLYLL